jgi:DNA-binding CsgD family transcriptional regulator
MADEVRSEALWEGISPLLAHSPVPRSGIEALSLQEREILFLVLEGLSSALIAQHLGTTEAAAKRKLKNLLHKIGVENRTQAVIWVLAKFRESSATPTIPPDGRFEAQHILVVDDGANLIRRSPWRAAPL